MSNSKYSKVLTTILIVAIVAIIGLLIYVGINWYKTYTTGADSESFFKEFEDYVNNEQTDIQNNQNTETNNVLEPNIDINDVEENSESDGITKKGNKLTYKGKNVVGTIEIPKTKVKYPVLEDASPKSIEIAIGKLYGPGINKVGNTVLAGHNFKDGTFFSNNKKLAVGDKIYLTDLTGKKVTYKITKKYTTDTNDFKYAVRDTKGKREISLTTCTDDTTARLIIWAVEI